MAPGTIQKAEKRGGKLIKECHQQQKGTGTRQGWDAPAPWAVAGVPMGEPPVAVTAMDRPELNAYVGDSRSQANNSPGFSLTCPGEKIPWWWMKLPRWFYASSGYIWFKKLLVCTAW